MAHYTPRKSRGAATPPRKVRRTAAARRETVEAQAMAVDPVPAKVAPVASTAPAVPAPAKPVPARTAASASPPKVPEPVTVSVKSPQPRVAAPKVVTPDEGNTVATINDTVKPVAEKTQALFADFNARTKAALEKSAKFGEEMTEFAKGNVEALVASGKVAAKGAEALTQDAADYGKKSFEHATATLKNIAAVKSPTEFFQLQSDYAKGAFDSAVAQASKLSEAWMKLAGDVVQPLSSRYAIAAEKIKGASAL